VDRELPSAVPAWRRPQVAAARPAHWGRNVVPRHAAAAPRPAARKTPGGRRDVPDLGRVDRTAGHHAPGRVLLAATRSLARPLRQQNRLLDAVPHGRRTAQHDLHRRGAGLRLESVEVRADLAAGPRGARSQPGLRTPRTTAAITQT